jgi:hypothetical protein
MGMTRRGFFAGCLGLLAQPIAQPLAQPLAQLTAQSVVDPKKWAAELLKCRRLPGYTGPGRPWVWLPEGE